MNNFYLPLLALGLAVWVPFAHSESTPVRIGVILPLSGELSYAGADIERGLSDCITSSKLSSSITISYEDNQNFNRVKIVSAYKKLVAEGSQMIMVSTMNEIKPLGSLVEKNRVPLLIIWDKYNKWVSSDYVKSIGFSVEGSAEGLALFASQSLGNRHIGIIAATDDWSQLVAKSFASKIELLGGTLSHLAEIDINELNITPHLLKAKSTGVDSLFLPLYGPSLAATLRQASNLKLTQAILTADGLTDPVINELGPLADGVYSYRPHKGVLEDAALDPLAPPGVDPGFYKMGISACKAAEIYATSGKLPTLSAWPTMKIGQVRSGKWVSH